MSSLPFLFLSGWGFILQAVAIVHFIRRRPDTYWLFIILMGGWIGALVYVLIEVVPDAQLLGPVFQAFPRRKRINELERAILDNPSAGNYEELGLLYLDDRKFGRARACYDKAISSRTDHPDPFYRRGVCEVELGDFAAAVPDLERVVLSEPDYDFHRAKGLLAHAYARTGADEKADAMFQNGVLISTLSETYLNFAEFLQSQGRKAEAAQWAQKVLDKKPSMPGYQRRRERPWFRRAKTILVRLKVGA